MKLLRDKVLQRHRIWHKHCLSVDESRVFEVEPINPPTRDVEETPHFFKVQQ
jgi:hypothetical protein